MRRVRVEQGWLEGVEQGACTAFLGVPYAAPPVGALRWRPPQPPAAWSGVRRAEAYGHVAMQFCADTDGDDFYGREFAEPLHVAPDEDCLSLNVFTPADAPGARLPVMFFIHGGAFATGAGVAAYLAPDGLCRRGVVLVSCNYRLNLFGFFTHPWLDAEGSPGNQGLYDQLAALSWVRRNIAAFGGDPDNITLFGQSAGAVSVQAWITSPLTRGWVAKAILHSGGGLKGMALDLPAAQARKSCQRLVARTGARDLDALRVIPAQELVAAAREQSLRGAPLRFMPHVDGKLLPHGFHRGALLGQVHDIPLLLGYTAQELDALGGVTGMSSVMIGRACVHLAQRQHQLGRSACYLYDFDRQLPGDARGAYHMAELWYVFGTLARCWRQFTPEDEALSQRMMDAWTAFAAHGDPNTVGLPEWVPYDPRQPWAMHLDTPPHMGPMDFPKGKRLVVDAVMGLLHGFLGRGH